MKLKSVTMKKAWWGVGGLGGGQGSEKARAH